MKTLEVLFLSHSRFCVIGSRLLCLSLCLLLTSCVSEPSKPEQSLKLEQVSLVIDNVTVIDAVNGLREAKRVLIKGRQIIDVIDADTSALLANSKVIDGRGKFLIPGLWDAHVHLSFSPELKDSMFRLFIANGVTSVRDTGGQLSKVLAWRDRAKTELAPEVYIAGPLIDGEPAVYSGKAKGFPNIAVSVTTASQVDALVAELASANVDLIKAYEMLSPDVYRSLLLSAKKYGLPVTGHVPLSMTSVQVSEAGLNSMEHLRNLEMDCAENAEQLLYRRRLLLAENKTQLASALRANIHAEQHFAAVSNFDPKRCARVMRTLAKNQTWQIPTLSLVAASSRPYFNDEQWWRTYQALPAAVQAKWLAASQKIKESYEKPSVDREQRKAVANWKLKRIPEMLEAGIPFMAGTDTPIFYLTPGFSLHKELETLVAAGMSPMQALASATLAPAEYFGLQNKQGAISAGQQADLVLLNKNPLLDIKNTKQIDSVIRNGRLLGRSELDALLRPDD